MVYGAGDAIRRNRGKTMNWQKNASALLSVCLGLAAYSSASAFSVGNATPASVYFVQGQSFTPADLGNAGSGTPHADSAGNAHLVSLHIAFAAGQTPPSTLYIYSTLPTNGNATTGVGSIASAPDSGGGTYVFNLPFLYLFPRRPLPCCRPARTFTMRRTATLAARICIR
jgi:hypothetical protein